MHDVRMLKPCCISFLLRSRLCLVLLIKAARTHVEIDIYIEINTMLYVCA